MSRYVALALLALSPFALAEDGLVVQFTISKRASGAGNLQTYADAILMKFDEEASFELADRYVLKIRSHKNGNSNFDMLVTLKDIIDGKPYYVGASPVNLNVGDTALVEFDKNERIYAISLDTSYGKLPPETAAQR